MGRREQGRTHLVKRIVAWLQVRQRFVVEQVGNPV
jgi:hypothetical protein